MIADSIELVARGHLFDAVVALSGCDKTIPGTVMALARLDVPSVMLYGGSIPPGRFQGRDVTIIDVFEAVGEHATGKMTDEELAELESVASPGAGACGGQFTANTMAMAFEMMGISPMGPSGVPAQEATQGAGGVRRRRAGDGRAAARPAPERADHARRRWRTRSPRSPSSGGSTNGVLHLLAVAQARPGVDARHRRLRPHLRAHAAAVRPQARRRATTPTTCTTAGGTAVLAQRLKELGILHADAPTVLGKTVGELADEAVEADGQHVVRPLDDPLKPTGGLAILRGNIAPEGCVVKLAGHERRHHSGPARVFEGEEAAMDAVTHGGIEPGDVVVIRNEGPPAAPGCARCSP